MTTPKTQTSETSFRKNGKKNTAVRTGIFGGSFNPVHNGHVSLARQLLTTAGLDEIWFVVSPQNPLKPLTGLIDDMKRLQMVRMALHNEPNLVACDYEFSLPKPSYMWHTLQSMDMDYPEREFVLLIGADNWTCFDRWFAWKKILDNHAVVIYPRNGSHIEEDNLPANVRLAHTDLFDISSTEIRRKIKNGESIDGLVKPQIAEFILSEKLYHSQR